MARFRMTASHIRRSLDAVAARDPDVARALAQFGYPEPRRRPEGFATLLRVIVGQQVSVQAATTIYGRLTAAMQDDMRPERLLRLRATSLRKAGLSGQKAHYARCLARAIDRAELDLPALAGLPDEQAIALIQAVPGLGLWSAQMYLMFSLGRPDIWPSADIGALRGLQCIKGLAERPTVKAGELLAEPFRPHRTAMALLAWKCASQKLAAPAVPLPPTRRRQRAGAR
jgi:DNA-3-methyladenine glycosylase II